MAPLTFRNSKIVYYGPHPCENCGIDVAKMGNDWGGTAFTYPQGPIYPNTEWHPHVCDPFEVNRKLGADAAEYVRSVRPTAKAMFSKQQGWMITCGDSTLNIACIGQQAYCATEAVAWLDAKTMLSK